MSVFESFRDKIFRVADPDARVRVSREEINSFARSGNDFIRIPQGQEVSVREVFLLDNGAAAGRIFALAQAADGSALGWTSTRNLAGSFRNETLGLVKPGRGAGRFGPNAAWSRGKYLGQIELVKIVSTDLKIRHIALDTIDDYTTMSVAAAEAGIRLTVNSGFRSYPEQKFLWDGYQRKLPGFNLAAKPGISNHQSGIAFDLDVAGGPGNQTYDWLAMRGPDFGFFRTVNKEFWHWECDPIRARQLASINTFKTSNVIV